MTGVQTCALPISGLLARPTSAAEIARQLARAVGPAHDELRAAGLERAAAFTWQACAQAHEELYRSLAEDAR